MADPDEQVIRLLQRLDDILMRYSTSVFALVQLSKQFFLQLPGPSIAFSFKSKQLYTGECNVIYYLIKWIYKSGIQKKYNSGTGIEAKVSILVPVSKVFEQYPALPAASPNWWHAEFHLL